MIYIENIKVAEISYPQSQKKVKKILYNHFRINLENIKNTWKDIKSIISLKCKDSDIPKIIKDKDSFLTAPNDIANSFHYFFLLCYTKYAHKSFNNFLKNPGNDLFLLNNTQIKNYRHNKWS